ncbi:methionine aminotransferase [Advenella incenata]
MQIRSKLPAVGTTVFSVIGDLAERHQAINLAQGAPNFPCAPELIDHAIDAMSEGHNQYSPMIGIEPLRNKIAEKIQLLYGHSYDELNEVTVMGSASEALYCAIAALIHPGDEVIYFEPCFDSYAPIVTLQGAVPVGIKLLPPTYGIDWDAVRDAVNERTRMIIINSPHNPSGAVLSDADIAALQDIVADTNIIILSDEVYEHVVFDQDIHRSMSRYDGLRERAVVVTSFGKTFHVTGWRIGYCVAPAAITAEIRKIHQFLMYCADTPMQYALAAMMETPNHYLNLSTIYQEKRDLLAHALKGSKFELLPSKGGFFMLARFQHFSYLSDVQLVRKLIEEFGVATIPVSAFYSDGTDLGVIRLSFSKDDATLEEGARRLCKL